MTTYSFCIPQEDVQAWIYALQDRDASLQAFQIDVDRLEIDHMIRRLNTQLLIENLKESIHV